MYKQLIADVEKDSFINFITQVMPENDLSDSGGVLSGPDYCKLIETASESDNFKAFLHTGFLAFVKGMLNSNAIADYELLHASRLSVGMNLGFKYAMYLHEQRELAAIISTDEGVPKYEDQDLEREDRQ